ncbi:tetratricopeptide repeat protein 21B-like [Protopterus annectens]|uniref:tetratricopeptide repeat protein 21B-like n=1 Tax=Protopterus annectens TaxID=7888 RepID=UPI001CF977C9|nr:tetratricopeptide repeat protein 21B-like [Protopterus annectens]
MSATDTAIVAAATYYFQEKYYRHVQTVVNEGLQKHNNDSVLLFFKAIGILMEDRTQEAIRELESVRRNPDVSLCSLMALIYAHKKSAMVDRDAVSELENNLKAMRKQAGEEALYYAGIFLWLMGRSDKAREYIDRMLKISNTSRKGLILKGWLDLSSEKEPVMKKSIRYLDEGIQDSKDIFGLMGKVKYFMMQQNYSTALDNANQIIAVSPNFLPALILKMKLCLAQQDWDRTLETAQRICQRYPTCLDALQMLAVYSMSRKGHLSQAADYVRSLVSALEDIEPRNPGLHVKMILSISRMCSKSPAILHQTKELVERAFRMNPADADLANELGYQNILQGQVKEALRCYTTAMNLDNNNVPAVIGIVQCQMLGGQLEEAEQQLEFLTEVQNSIGIKSGDLAYLKAVIASKRNRGEDIVVAFLKEAIESHFSAMNNLPLGIEYFEQLNPVFLVGVVKEYMVFCPNQPKSPGQTLSPLLKVSAMILDPVVKAAPGIMETLFLMAQIKYLSGDFEAAHAVVQRCLEQDASFSDGHLLMGQIYLSEGSYKQCLDSLELSVSHNFQVREQPLYHLIKARALKKMGNIPEAVKTLKIIMSLPGMKRVGGEKSKAANISISDKVSVYLELAEVLSLNGEQHEATKVMQDALNEFKGTPEEIRIAVANVDLALNKGDAEIALSMLRNIASSQPYYTEAKEKMAYIYLSIRKDKKLYIGCYRDLCDNLPSPHSSLLLGDAYMNIQEPEKAIEVYEQALKQNPRDPDLASRTGQALVKTHQYNKAIRYYEAALKLGGQEFLCFDLAELLLKLKQYDKAETLMAQVLDHDSVNDLPTLMDDVKCLLLLADVYKKTLNVEKAVDTLSKGYEIQSKILKRIAVEQPEIMPSQRKLISSICFRLAKHSKNQKDYEKAVKYCRDALAHNEIDNKVMLELASLYLIQGDVEACQHQCNLLLEHDPGNADAKMMLADLLFQKQENKEAIFHCKQLLEKKQDNFSVLCQLIDLLWRSGTLDEAVPILDNVEKGSSRVTLEPGFSFCKGLYMWYMGRPNEALKHFNKARKDSDWGEKAICNMIQICLNPDNETLGGEVFENITEDTSNFSAERYESEQLAVKTAQKLLKEFYPRSKQQQDQLLLLKNICLMATKDKQNIETALQVFMNMATAEKEHVPSILAMAQAFMILKQTPRARNQLKRLSKTKWNSSDAMDLEKSWLLLADIYIKAGKHDNATELLKRCLKYNKSCCKAYEYLGFIMETEHSYKDAATKYEMAWKYSNNTNPAIGYKLAFNYLKAQKFVAAIEICHKVLSDYPRYPKIHSEILEKAQSSIKP